MKWTQLMVVAALLSLSATAFAQYRSPSRINFDERLIKGQTTKSGSIYIFDRQETAIKSLVKRGRSFRFKIIRTVFEK